MATRSDLSNELSAFINQADNPVAKKYPIKGKLQGTIYGAPEVTSILARFEGRILDAWNYRDTYVAGSKAWDNRCSRIRLEAAQAIMELSQRVAADRRPRKTSEKATQNPTIIGDTK